MAYSDKIKILYVDDDTGTFSALKRRMDIGNPDLELVHVKTLLDAELEMASDHPPKIIVTDLQVPQDASGSRIGDKDDEPHVIKFVNEHVGKGTPVAVFSSWDESNHSGMPIDRIQQGVMELVKWIKLQLDVIRRHKTQEEVQPFLQDFAQKAYEATSKARGANMNLLRYRQVLFDDENYYPADQEGNYPPKHVSKLKIRSQDDQEKRGK